MSPLAERRVLSGDQEAERRVLSGDQEAHDSPDGDTGGGDELPGNDPYAALGGCDPEYGWYGSGRPGANGREHEVVPCRTAENYRRDIAAPNAGAGANIGKEDATINVIRNQTGARLHVSPKESQVCAGGGGDGGSLMVCGVGWSWGRTGVRGGGAPAAVVRLFT